MVEYTKPDKVTDMRASRLAPRNPYASGYGPKIPSRYMIRYGKHWHRVYVALFGNSGSSYICGKGGTLYLDSATEQRLQDLPRDV